MKILGAILGVVGLFVAPVVYAATSCTLSTGFTDYYITTRGVYSTQVYANGATLTHPVIIAGLMDDYHHNESESPCQTGFSQNNGGCQTDEWPGIGITFVGPNPFSDPGSVDPNSLYQMGSIRSGDNNAFDFSIPPVPPTGFQYTSGAPVWSQTSTGMNGTCYTQVITQAETGTGNPDILENGGTYYNDILWCHSGENTEQCSTDPITGTSRGTEVGVMTVKDSLGLSSLQETSGFAGVNTRGTCVVFGMAHDVQSCDGTTSCPCP